MLENLRQFFQTYEQVYSVLQNIENRKNCELLHIFSKRYNTVSDFIHQTDRMIKKVLALEYKHGPGTVTEHILKYLREVYTHRP